MSAILDPMRTIYAHPDTLDRWDLTGVALKSGAVLWATDDVPYGEIWAVELDDQGKPRTDVYRIEGGRLVAVAANVP